MTHARKSTKITEGEVAVILEPVLVVYHLNTSCACLVAYFITDCLTKEWDHYIYYCMCLSRWFRKLQYQGHLPLGPAAFTLKDKNLIVNENVCPQTIKPSGPHFFLLL